jgi:hypothetical protein
MSFKGCIKSPIILVFLSVFCVSLAICVITTFLTKQGCPQINDHNCHYKISNCHKYYNFCYFEMIFDNQSYCPTYCISISTSDRACPANMSQCDIKKYWPRQNCFLLECTNEIYSYLQVSTGILSGISGLILLVLGINYSYRLKSYSSEELTKISVTPYHLPYTDL